MTWDETNIQSWYIYDFDFALRTIYNKLPVYHACRLQCGLEDTFLPPPHHPPPARAAAPNLRLRSQSTTIFLPRFLANGLYMIRLIMYMHRWLLGIILDLSTTPDALDLLQIPGCLRLAAKLRGSSAKLQINIIVDSVAQKHSPAVLPSNQLQLMVLDHARTAYWSKLLSSVTNGQKV